MRNTVHDMKNTHQTQETYKTYAEINLDALEHNYRVIADAVNGENVGTLFCAKEDPAFDLVEYVEETY